MSYFVPEELQIKIPLIALPLDERFRALGPQGILFGIDIICEKTLPLKIKETGTKEAKRHIFLRKKFVQYSIENQLRIGVANFIKEHEDLNFFDISLLELILIYYKNFLSRTLRYKGTGAIAYSDKPSDYLEILELIKLIFEKNKEEREIKDPWNIKGCSNQSFWKERFKYNICTDPVYLDQDIEEEDLIRYLKRPEFVEIARKAAKSDLKDIIVQEDLEEGIEYCELDIFTQLLSLSEVILPNVLGGDKYCFTTFSQERIDISRRISSKSGPKLDRPFCTFVIEENNKKRKQEDI